MASTRSSDISEVWRTLLIAFTGIADQLEAEMKEEFGLPMEHYEVLLMLFEAGNDGLRPSEIAAKRRFSRSGATRLVDRLVRDGLVERREHDDDRRGCVILLSEQGRKTFTAAGRVHLDGIERHVGSRLTGVEAETLRQLLGKLIPAGSNAEASELGK